MKNQEKVSQGTKYHVIFLQIVSVYWDRCWDSAL